MTGPGAGGWCCELFQGLLPGWGAGIFGAKGLADLAAGLAPGAGQAAYGVVSEASLGFALAAQDFLVQVVALYVADELVEGWASGACVSRWLRLIWCRWPLP